jgi:hypothetical protein
MKVIRFRRLYKKKWEIAFHEDDLRSKLGGEVAEVIMPAKPWWIRLWRRFFPVRCIDVPADGVMREYKLS